MTTPASHPGDRRRSRDPRGDELHADLNHPDTAAAADEPAETLGLKEDLGRDGRVLTAVEALQLADCYRVHPLALSSYLLGRYGGRNRTPTPTRRGNDLSRSPVRPG